MKRGYLVFENSQAFEEEQAVAELKDERYPEFARESEIRKEGGNPLQPAKA